jgi:hypothetical protein
MTIAPRSRIPEEVIRSRSYAIWESEGRQPGRAEEFWLRALAELEEELDRYWRAALSPDAATNLVMPRPAISEPPTRREAGRIDINAFREAA